MFGILAQLAAQLDALVLEGIGVLEQALWECLGYRKVGSAPSRKAAGP